MVELEPLPKVTFLPAQLTELVIKNWTGDIIDFEKNGQVCILLLMKYRFARCITDRAPASSERATSSKGR